MLYTLHFPESPFYVLGVAPKRAWYQRSNRRAEAALIQTLLSDLKMPGRTLIVSLTGSRESLRDVFNRIEGARIYDK